MKTVMMQYRKTLDHPWVDAWRARVLFSDRRNILVRGAGAASLFGGNGKMIMVSYDPKHSATKALPRRHGRWRLSPESVKRPKGTR